MIKLFIGLLLLVTISTYAQTTVFSEDFENLPLTMTSSGSVQWARSTVFHVSGNYCDSVALNAANDTAILTSNTISTTGNSFISLEFNHICKFEYFDKAIIEISTDNGTSWTQLTQSSYLGTAQFGANGNRFNSVSYPLDWMTANNNAVPTASWWKHEIFNISSIAANTSQLKIRFVAIDVNGSGGAGNYGWLLDDVKVKASPAELIPPTIAMVAPILQDSAFGTGPYTIEANISDASGIDTAMIIYTVGTITDTIGMNNVNSSLYSADIPSQPINTIVSYYVVAIDNSSNNNIKNSQTYTFTNYIESKIIQIGYGNTDTYYAPFYNSTISSTDTISDHVSLFTAQELHGYFGNITQVDWFKSNAVSSTGSAEVEIYLKATNDASVSTNAGTVSTLLTGATLVYQNNNYVITNNTGFISFNTNQNTFFYDGTSNLYVIVRWVRKGTLSTDYLRWAYTYESGKSITFKGSASNPTSIVGNGYRPNTKIHFTDPITNYDAGVKEITSPGQVVLSTQSNPVNVRIYNSGTTTLTKVNVNYELDGIAQTTTNWTGNLASNFNSSDITLGSHNFSLGNHNLKVWTSLPNDSADQYNYNDTMRLDFFACNFLLSGNYTVGGSNADFIDFVDAMAAIQNCGIVGPVVFHVNPGNYNVDLTFDNTILGLDSTKTINFRSATGNAQDVILKNGNSSKNYVVGFDGCSYISFSNISFDARETGILRAISIEGGANNIIIDSCRIYGNASSNSQDYPFYVEGLSSNIKLINSYIEGGYYAINFAASSTNTGYNALIENNIISGFERTAIYLGYFNNSLVSNNKIRKEYQANGSTLIGIYIYHGDYSHCIGNDIIMHPYNASYGIYYSYGANTIGRRLVSNNIVILKGSSTSTAFRALYNGYASNVNYYNNTFVTYAGSANSETAYIEGSGSDIHFKNNIFANFGGSYAFEKTSSSYVTGMDYNSYYTNGGILVNWGGTQIAKSTGIAGISAITLMDSNSILANPMLYGQDNGHSFSPDLNGAGIPLSEVIYDFDGQLRDTLTPDIGADEFSISSIDLSLVKIIEPFVVDTQNRVANVGVLVVNSGSDTIHVLNMIFQVNNSTPVNYAWTGTLNPAESDTIFPGTFTVAPGQNQFKIYSSILADTLNQSDTISMSFTGLPIIEAELVSIDSPMDGCAKSNSEPVMITIQNNGLQNISSGLSASYRINGGSVTTENIINIIPVGQTYQFTFDSTVDMTVSGIDSIFNFDIWLSHSSDSNHMNDSLFLSVLSQSYLTSPIVSDTTINYGTSALLLAQSPLAVEWYQTETSVPVIWSDSIYNTPNLFDTTTYWVRANTNIPSYTAIVGTATNVGGPFDNNPYGGGMSAGKFQLLFTASELLSSGLAAGAIESIALNLAAGTSSLSLMEISIATTNISFLTSSFENPSFTTVYTSPLSAITGWNTHSFSTPFYWDGTSNIILQFCTTGPSYMAPPVYYTTTTFNSMISTAGMGASCSSTSGFVTPNRPNVKFVTAGSAGCSSLRVPVTVNVPKPSKDGLILSINSPVSGCGLASTPVTVDVRNNGVDTVPGGYSLTYKIDNGSYITPEVVNSPIAPGDTITYTFNTSALLPPGANGTKYVITAKTLVPNDGYSGNDSLISDTISSLYTPSNPILSDLTINYGTSAILSGITADTIYWFNDSLGQSLYGMGNHFQTSPLFDTTTFWAQSRRTILQNDYTVGNGTATVANHSPYGSNQYGSKNQYLIRAQELKALGMMEGNIFSLAFDISSVKGIPLNNYTIKMGSTAETDLDRTYFLQDLTTVYTNSAYVDVFGWNIHQFSTPFYWDGISNIIIETCFHNTSSGGFAGVKYTFTSYLSVANTTGYGTFSCNDSTISNKFSTRPNIKFNQVGYGVCGSDLMPLTVNLSNYSGIDAGVESISLPSSSASSIIADTVQVVLKNYGLNNLTSAQINWTENGISQTPYNWTGNLAHGMVDTVNITTNHLFDGGITELKVWSNLLNDSIHTNDTTVSLIDVCMSGNYLVSANNGHFGSLAEAINNLDMAGVCGPVVIELDSGIYSGQYIIDPIMGASSTNTISFRSVDLDSSYVTIMHTTTQNLNYVIKINGASYINFSHLGLLSNASTYSNVIVLENGAHDIIISNCKLTSGLVTSGTASNIYSENSNISNIIIENNHFYNGFKSINLLGTGSNYNSNVTISNNIFENFGTHATYIYYLNNLVFNSNNIFSANNTTSYGIYGYYIQNGIQAIGNTITLSPTGSGYGMYLSASGTAVNRGLIANNFISILSGMQSRYGIYNYNSSYVDIVYNSTYNQGGGSTAYGLYLGGVANMKVLNNSIYSQSGYAIRTNSPNGFDIFDYNNIHTDPSSSTYVYWGSGAVANLAALKLYNTSFNQHSLDVDPQYFSITDLHSQQILLYNTGLPFAGITTDIDGDLRHATTPSIGADQFTPPTIDLGIAEIVYPKNNDCGYSSSDSIVVKLSNYGINNINFSTNPTTLKVIITGINPDTISVVLNSGVLNSASDSNIVLTNNYDLSLNGIYEFVASVSILNDGYSGNDQTSPLQIISYPVINTFPFIENFESGQNIKFKTIQGSDSEIGVDGASANQSTYSLHFQGGGYTNWANSSNVIGAFNNTTHVTKAFTCEVDASSLNFLSMKFDLRQTSYDLNTLNYYSWFRVLLIDNNGIHYLKNNNGDSVFQPLTVNGDPFTTQTFNLNDYAGQAFQISLEACNRYEYGTGSYDGDNAFVDNFNLWSPTSTDAAITQIKSSSTFGQVGQPKNIKIIVSNFGNDTLTQIPIGYTVNGGTAIRDTMYVSLPPSQIDSFTFLTPLTLMTGNQFVKAFTSVAGDVINQNDTMELKFKGLQNITVDYIDNFENVDYWHGTGTQNQWELGTPTTTVINAAHSGVNAWVTKLNSNYISSTNEYLYSPYITIPLNSDTAIIEFFHYMRLYSGQAYGTLEYSLNGTQWSSIGYMSDPLTTNWYNTVINGKHVWSSLNTQWLHSSIKLDPAIFNTGNAFQLRFAFGSASFSNTDEGWAIDDFSIKIPKVAKDAGITSISSPATVVNAGSSSIVTAIIKNFGLDTLYSIPVKYSYSGLNINEVWTGILLPDSSVTYSFTNQFSPSQAGSLQLCVKTLLTGEQKPNNDELCINITVGAGAKDAAITSIITPTGQTTVNGNIDVRVQISNKGTDTLTQIPVGFIVGTTNVNETYTGQILPGDSALYDFVGTYVSPAGSYLLSAYTLLAGDVVGSNDTLSINLLGTSFDEISKDGFRLGQNEPNPMDQVSYVPFFIPNADKVEFVLMAIDGRIIYSEIYNFSAGANRIKVDASNLNRGVYYYSMIYKGQKLTKQLFVL